jgi:hypothetical protein
MTIREIDDATSIVILRSDATKDLLLMFMCSRIGV